jgi:hypothetical protein
MVSNRKQNGSEITSLNYFAEIGKPGQSICRSSFSEARSKLSWECFAYLLDELNRAADPQTWKGHRIRACDGSHLTLPASKEILEHFPRRENEQSQTHYPKGLLVTVTDILTGVPSIAKICSGEYGSERDMLVSMLDDFETGDILLLDRGYEGVDHLFEIHRRGQNFITRVRASGSCSGQVNALLHSGKKSIDVAVKTKSGESYMVRLVRMGRDRVGLPIVVCTNLIDKSKYSNREIFEIYLRRWEIETMYHRVKQLFSIEKFYARSLNGVLQEIWANLFMLGLTAFTVRATDATTKVSAPSFKNASEVVRRHLHNAVSIRLTPRLAIKCAREMLEQIASIHSRKQVGRKNPRTSKQPTNKWNVHRPLTKNRPTRPRKKTRKVA